MSTSSWSGTFLSLPSNPFLGNQSFVVVQIFFLSLRPITWPPGPATCRLGLWTRLKIVVLTPSTYILKPSIHYILPYNPARWIATVWSFLSRPYGCASGNSWGERHSDLGIIFNAQLVDKSVYQLRTDRLFKSTKVMSCLESDVFTDGCVWKQPIAPLMLLPQKFPVRNDKRPCLPHEQFIIAVSVAHHRSNVLRVVLLPHLPNVSRICLLNILLTLKVSWVVKLLSMGSDLVLPIWPRA